MATPKTLRPLLRLQPSITLSRASRRTFLPNPFPASFSPLGSSQPQTLSASRTLPYPSHPIYAIISDVSSYSSFLPYCPSSDVTKWSAPDATYNRRWPSEGRLSIGFGSLTETFTSRVYCVPGRIVESVGGKTETDLDRRDIAHHLVGEQPSAERKEGENGLLTHLKSRWTVEEVGRESTRVTLALEFAFANPLYTTLSAGAAPKVAEVMVKAFEERVRGLLEGRPDMQRASLGDFEGSVLKR
ncbi:hypothetical protein BS50DRAFT_575149 [Corynespora cassiicola Philippines]|uniref:Coenzyme Q-binding protein COQ10 START domain-containing protein n=1 Tax=Corynespora cassiicola Philippines TaxID=1448308 RepID=A0A2T2NHZ7_CORCC|nr:hypothetical protein BS50DRAFT_575149 [Corynespora cassiicola Philippines]